MQKVHWQEEITIRAATMGILLLTSMHAPKSTETCHTYSMYIALLRYKFWSLFQLGGRLSYVYNAGEQSTMMQLLGGLN